MSTQSSYLYLSYRRNPSKSSDTSNLVNLYRIFVVLYLNERIFIMQYNESTFRGKCKWKNFLYFHIVLDVSSRSVTLASFLKSELT